MTSFFSSFLKQFCFVLFTDYGGLSGADMHESGEHGGVGGRPSSPSGDRILHKLNMSIPLDEK